MICAQHVGNDTGIKVVSMRARLAVTLPRALDGIRRNNENGGIAARPQAIDEEGMDGLETNPTISKRDSKLATGGI